MKVWKFLNWITGTTKLLGDNFGLVFRGINRHTLKEEVAKLILVQNYKPAELLATKTLSKLNKNYKGFNPFPKFIKNGIVVYGNKSYACIVTQYVNGTALDELDWFTELDVNVVLKILRSVLIDVETKYDFIHGDLAPRNILMVRNEEKVGGETWEQKTINFTPTLIDFGASEFVLNDELYRGVPVRGPYGNVAGYRAICNFLTHPIEKKYQKKLKFLKDC